MTTVESERFAWASDASNAFHRRIGRYQREPELILTKIGSIKTSA